MKTPRLLKENYGDFRFSTTPQWVRVTQLIGIGIAALGTAIATGGAGLPAMFIVAAPYLTVGGTAITLFAQGIKKKEILKPGS